MKYQFAEHEFKVITQVLSYARKEGFLEPDYDYLIKKCEWAATVDEVTTRVEQKENPKFRLKVHYFKCNDCEEITLIEKTPLVNPLYTCPNCMEPMELMDTITVVQED